MEFVFAPRHHTWPPGLDHQHRREIAESLLRSLAGHSRRGLIGFPGALVVLGTASEDLLRGGRLFLALAAVVLVGTVARGLLVARFDRAFERLGERRWFGAFALTIVVSAVAWACVVAAVANRELVADGRLGSGGLVGLLITIALASQAIQMYASSLALVVGYLLAVLLPPLVVLAAHPEPATLGIALGGSIFGAYSFVSARALHRELWLSSARAKLLERRAEELAEAEASLRSAHDELEARVRERTADYEEVARELRRRERDYRHIFENAHDAILILRPEDELVLEVNPRACELYGTTREELVGSLLTRYSVDVERGREKVRETLEAGTCLSFQTRQRRADDSLVDIEVNASLIEYQGEVAILSLNRDITQRRRHDALLLAKETAERSNRAKDEFLANMSHEIRTPMAGIIGLSGLLLKEEDLPSRHRRKVETILDSAEALLEIIDDILDLSKMESGIPNLERVPFAPADLVGRIRALLGPRAESGGLRFETTIEETVPAWLLGVPTRLRQVLLNLLGNAIKFTETGSVTLRVSPAEPPGEIGEPFRLRFEVVDTGVGIAEVDRGRMFEPFTQVDPTSSRRHGGTGLGLAISKRLVEAMGGTLELESVPGAGSTFRFTVPVEAVAAPEPRETVTLGDRCPRILLAEDNPVNRMVMTEHLELLGCEVEAVEDGLYALEKLEEACFDLVLLDCQMPRLDGYETARRIRAAESEEGKPRLPIVAVTAHALAADREKCFEAGMDDHLSKPFTEARLAETLGRWLRE